MKKKKKEKASNLVCQEIVCAPQMVRHNLKNEVLELHQAWGPDLAPQL